MFKKQIFQKPFISRLHNACRLQTFSQTQFHIVFYVWIGMKLNALVKSFPVRNISSIFSKLIRHRIYIEEETEFCEIRECMVTPTWAVIWTEG